MIGIALRDRGREQSVMRARLVAAMVIIVVLTLVLLGRLGYLQLIQHQHFSTLSQENRIDLVPVAPVRGLIYDRNGVVLAENIPVYNLDVTPDKVPDMTDMLDRLMRIVYLSDDDITRFRKILRRRSAFARQVLRADVSSADAARFAVNEHRFPGVELVGALQRQYPLGALTAHVVGYVGRISAADLDRIDHQRYRGSNYIGKLGIESYYESILLGEPGFQRVETNAHGREVRILSHTPPVAGHNLHLTIDARLQEVARNALGNHRGAIVAIDPGTGGILAFVSSPSYDPNPFVNGIGARSYAALRDSPDQPLLNRALQGRYAPGSTIKGFMALAGLDNGLSPTQTVFCPGYFKLPNHSHRYRDWKHGGHGRVNLHEAIEQSCDVYFYHLANTLGIDKIHRYLTGFGFGRRVGVDLNGEPSGLIPSPEWKRRVRHQPWYPGETVIAGIGQGYILVTPLQLAAATALLANRGRAIRPHFLAADEDPQTRSSIPYQEVPLSALRVARKEYYEEVVKGMIAVVNGPRGTARRIGRASSYLIAGKSGTAQVIGIAQNKRYDASRIDARHRDHALFIAFAPANDPQIAVAAVVENGGGGSSVAAPMTKQVMDYYLLDRVPAEPAAGLVARQEFGG